MRNTAHIDQRNITRTPFNVTNICSMDPCKMSEFFLRNLLGQAQSPNRLPEIDFEIAWFWAAHGNIV
jgi:hypothetical protein